MTERVRRSAVWMLTWLVATASATAMAWWAVTFVTVEVDDRRPLQPSDVVAASVLPVVPASPRADGSPVVGPPPGGAAAPELPPGAANPASENDGGGGAPPQTISTPVAGANRSSATSPARLVARWSATPEPVEGADGKGGPGRERGDRGAPPPSPADDAGTGDGRHCLSGAGRPSRRGGGRSHRRPLHPGADLQSMAVEGSFGPGRGPRPEPPAGDRLRPPASRRHRVGHAIDSSA